MNVLSIKFNQSSTKRQLKPIAVHLFSIGLPVLWLVVVVGVEVGNLLRLVDS